MYKAALCGNGGLTKNLLRQHHAVERTQWGLKKSDSPTGFTDFPWLESSLYLASPQFLHKKINYHHHKKKNMEEGRPDDSSIPPNLLLWFHPGFHTSWNLCQPASASQPSEPFGRAYHGALHWLHLPPGSFLPPQDKHQMAQIEFTSQPRIMIQDLGAPALEASVPPKRL